MKKRRIRYVTDQEIKELLKGNKYQVENARKVIELKKKGFNVAKSGRGFRSLEEFKRQKNKELNKKGSNKDLIRRASARKFRTILGRTVYRLVVKKK